MVMRTVGDVFALNFLKPSNVPGHWWLNTNLFLHGKASALAQVLVTYTNLERLQAPSYLTGVPLHAYWPCLLGRLTGFWGNWRALDG